MTTIRRLTYFDHPKLKKLISYLCTDDNDKLAKSLLEEPIGFVNAILPLPLKFKSESFILIENNEILGLITVTTTAGNHSKINITRLIFKENMYEIGKQLVEFIMQKYGAKGALSFNVTVDECHEELLDLFVNGCGFRQCSSETLWKIENFTTNKENIRWRYAQNSDANSICDLYNHEIKTIFKPSLERNPKEFMTPTFQGFTDFYKTRYLTEESGKILYYFSITTSDNLNYILDITANSGYETDYDAIINAMLTEISSKKKGFYPFIKQKKYVNNSEEFEQYLRSKNYTPIQTQHILVKNYYKQAAETSSLGWEVFSLGENSIT